MAQIFPEWANKLQTYAAVVSGLLVVGVVGFFWYYGSPEYTDAGYRPEQPVAYSHKLHAGDLGMDCRYCHSSMEESGSANVPATQTCMNCHKLILTESERLLPVRESLATGIPIRWVRVHNLPDYAYFNHSAHLAAGVGCSSCHGNVAEMNEVMQTVPLSMGWCLECHRRPGPHLRPQGQLTDTKWTPPEDQERFAEQVIREKGIDPLVDCSGCHR